MNSALKLLKIYIKLSNNELIAITLMEMF